MIHYVDGMEDWESVCSGPVMAYARELKEKGIIRAIGLSSLTQRLPWRRYIRGLWMFLMFSVNPCYDLQPAGEDVEALWAEKKLRKAPCEHGPGASAPV